MMTQNESNLTKRRSFLAKGLLALTGTGVLTRLTKNAEAGYGPNNIPTTMTISLPATIRRTQIINCTARIQRLDGSTVGLAGMGAQFYAGPLPYPNSNIGRYYADASGYIRFSFAASFWLNQTGNYVIIADVNPTSCPDASWIAAPRPFARFTVTL